MQVAWLYSVYRLVGAGCLAKHVNENMEEKEAKAAVYRILPQNAP